MAQAGRFDTTRRGVFAGALALAAPSVPFNPDVGREAARHLRSFLLAGGTVHVSNGAVWLGRPIPGTPHIQSLHGAMAKEPLRSEVERMGRLYVERFGNLPSAGVA